MKKKEIKIAIDLMGSEIPPMELLKACISEEKKIAPNLSFVFIGTKELEKYAQNKNAEFVLAKNVINLDENPLFALRKKKSSSISLGIKLLKNDKADALISAGSTGAMMSLAKLNLSMLPHILRPSLLALLPTENKTLSAIDVGANISSKSKYLVQNALLGASFQKAMGNKHPILALLNIGSEAQKGPLELKKAFEELKKISSKTGLFKFAGNIEPTEIFQSDVDVLVTDGFTGNIFLKTSEGALNFIINSIARSNQGKMPSSKISSLLSDLKNGLYQNKYPGALLCGIDKIVVKCHSYSSISSFICAIKGTVEFVEKKIAESISNNLKLISQSKN